MPAALPFISLGLNFLGGMQQRNAAEAQGQAAIQQQRAQAQADGAATRIAECRARLGRRLRLSS